MDQAWRIFNFPLSVPSVRFSSVAKYVSYQNLDDSARIEDDSSSACRDGRIRYVTSILEGVGKSFGRTSHLSRIKRRYQWKVNIYHFRWVVAPFGNVSIIILELLFTEFSDSETSFHTTALSGIVLCVLKIHMWNFTRLITNITV